MELDNKIYEATQFLVSRCDGAVSEDAMGFNKYDAVIGHSLAKVPFEKWTGKQVSLMYRVLCKYKKQLSYGGIDYDAIGCPVNQIVYSNHRHVILDKQGKAKIFRILFHYDPELVNIVRTLPQRRWNSVDKYWSVPVQFETIEPVLKFALSNNFELADEILDEIYELSNEFKHKIELSKSASAEVEILGLGGVLRPFQKAGVSYARLSKRCFIADEMGLGKTIMALATVHAENAYPFLVVCPASLKLNWEREATKWLPNRKFVVISGRSGKIPQGYDGYIINYDVLRAYEEQIKVLLIQAVIFDESHYCKGYRSLRTKSAKAISKKIPIRLNLTGTPLLNRPKELISQLDILGRLDDMGGFWNFGKRYCNMHQGQWGLMMDGASNLDELNDKLRATCYIRRNKKDVLKELPDKQRSIFPVEITNRKEYDWAAMDLISWLRGNVVKDADFLESIKDLPEESQKEKKRERANEATLKAIRAQQLVRIEKLKKLSAEGKLEAVYEWIDSFLETGEKLVVYAHHRDIVATLSTKYHAPSITGQTEIVDRQKAVDQFQTDDNCKVIVCNIQAGGVGITLTAASNVLFTEFAWNPSVHGQAEDREHRIGQKNMVTAWYLVGKDTIDEDIMDLIERKRVVVDAATEGGKEGEGVSVLSELIERLTNR